MKPLKYDIISTHLRESRLCRISIIMEKVGYNGVVAEIIDELNPAHIQNITDTGILFITARCPDGKVLLITGFLITIDKLTAIYKGKRIPPALYNTVIRNMKKYPELYKMKEQGRKPPLSFSFGVRESLFELKKDFSIKISNFYLTFGKRHDIL